MKTSTVLFTTALMLFVAGGALAANLGSGVIITMTGASSYAVQFGDTVRFAYYEPASDQESCGTTFEAGTKYPIFLVDSTENDNVQAMIVWEPVADADLSEFPYGQHLEVMGLAPTPRYPNTLQVCDRITLQWQNDSGGGKDVTVNMFRDRQTAGLFSFLTN